MSSPVTKEDTRRRIELRRWLSPPDTFFYSCHRTAHAPKPWLLRMSQAFPRFLYPSIFCDVVLSHEEGERYVQGTAQIALPSRAP